MESYRHTTQNFSQALDDAQQQGYVDGYAQANIDYPLRYTATWLFGFVIGLSLATILAVLI